MSFKCDEVQEGDILRCVANGGNCCYAIGDEFVVELRKGNLVFKPKCYDQYREYFHVAARENKNTFELRKMTGPW